MKHFSLLPLSLLALATCTNAVHLPLSGRRSALQRRVSTTGTLVNDTGDLTYTTNIALNGKILSVLIDTGSSDLWVSPPIPGAVSQNYTAGVTYMSGSASGPVMSANLNLAGFSIEEQFFIAAQNASAANDTDGLLGLGPGSGSEILANGNSSAALQPLDRIFGSNSSILPLLAILLQRANDPDEPFPGQLSIGEVPPEYQDVLDQPQLPVTMNPLAYTSVQHWQTFLDVDGIIGPNAKPIDVKTNVTNAKVPNATVFFDTGFSFSQVHPSVAEAVYGNIPGATFQNISDFGPAWILNCDQVINVTFLFQGVQYPIHPLDLSMDGDAIGVTDELDGTHRCIGGFQPYGYDMNGSQNETLFDMILGMSFLRNVFMAVNLGNMVNGSTPANSTAYIQLLSITNATEAALDYENVRRNSTKTKTGSQLSSYSSSGHTSKSESWMIGLAVGLGLFVLLVAGVAYYRCRRRAKNASGTTPPRPKNLLNYNPISDPMPKGAYDMHMGSAAPPGHAMSEYRTPWDVRH